MLTTLAIANYRSIRKLIVSLAPLTIITGSNGSGKSSFYRALQLLADVAQGRVVQSLAREGGLESTLWAGPETIARSVKSGLHPVQGTRRKEPIHLRLGFASDEFGYAIDLGLPPPSHPAAFMHDPQIKRECVWAGEILRPSTMLVDRQNIALKAKNGEGDWEHIKTDLSAFDSMMAVSADARATPELITLRDTMRSWRFYDHLRTDREAPARIGTVGTYTPVLAGDGSDLAAAIQTILSIGDDEALHETIADAFDGASVSVNYDQPRFELRMQQPGLLRHLGATELSDGTLRYLLLAAALLTPRPPPLMVLNEPETSLHPDLLPPLGRLIAKAARSTQIIVVSHSSRLIAAMEEAIDVDVKQLVLEKQLGETIVRDNDEPRWEWAER